MKHVIRMWDTYLAEGTAPVADCTGFSEFHVYVCAAFLTKWSEQLRSMDFQVCFWQVFRVGAANIYAILTNMLTSFLGHNDATSVTANNVLG